MNAPHRMQLRRAGWLAVLATGVVLFAASLQGIADVRTQLAQTTPAAPPALGVPVSYRPTDWRGDGRGCHERGGRDVRDKPFSPERPRGV